MPVTVNLRHLACHRFLFFSVRGTRDGPFTAPALCMTPVIVLIVISDTFTLSVKDLGVSDDEMTLKSVGSMTADDCIVFIPRHTWTCPVHSSLLWHMVWKPLVHVIQRGISHVCYE